MFDFEAEIYKDNVLIKVNFANYIKNKKILICPNIKMSQRPTLCYLKYIDSLIDTYNIDEVIIINSTPDKFFHVLVQSYFPRFTTVTDKSQIYIKSLKQIKNKTDSIETLVQKWTYQQALYDCKELGFWEQPLSDYWKHLLANKRAIKELMKFGSWQRKIIQKLYKSRHTTNLWNITDQNILRYSTTVGYSLGGQMGANFFYFNLFHNKDLESVLHQINNNR